MYILMIWRTRPCVTWRRVIERILTLSLEISSRKFYTFKPKVGLWEQWHQDTISPEHSFFLLCCSEWKVTGWNWIFSCCVSKMHLENTLTSYSLCVCDDVAKDIVGFLPASFDVQLQFGNVHRLFVWFLVHKRSRWRCHLLDPSLHLWHLLHRLSGVLLLHRHPHLAGSTLDVFQPHLLDAGRLQGDVVQVSRRRTGIQGRLIEVGEKFGEEVSTLRLK